MSIAVNHKPASALPWAVDMSGEGIAHTDEGEEVDVFDSAALPHVPQRHVAKDAAYSVHAANAYPRMVAALGTAFRNLTDKAAREEIGALLNDLGEAS